MTNVDLGDFTRTAQAMVRRNDRTAWRRDLGRYLTRRLQTAGVLWSALALAAVLLVLVLPMNVRLAE